MKVVYWDKLISGIDSRIEKLENELKGEKQDIERIEKNGKIIVLMQLKNDILNGDFGKLEIGD